MFLFWQIAFRNIFRQRRRTWFTGLTIGGGYLLLSVIQGISDGSYNNIIRIFTEAHTGHIQIHRPEFVDRPQLHYAMRMDKHNMQLITSSPHVKGASKRIRGWGLAYQGEKSMPVPVLGIETDKESRLTTLGKRVVKGQLPSTESNRHGYFEAAIGASLAKQLELDLGSELILISQAADGSVANDIFIVSGVIGDESSMDRFHVYLSLPVAQSFFLLDNQVHEIMIVTYDIKLAAETSRRLQALPEFKSLVVRPWQEIEKDFYQAMQADKEGNKVVNFIIILIVSLGVLNTVLMMILERTREYGILKALGTRPAQIILLITLETAQLTFLSILTALFFSLPLNYYLANYGIQMPQAIDIGGMSYDKIMSEISWYSTIAPAVYLFLIIIPVSLFPAWRAARREALVAMQHI